MAERIGTMQWFEIVKYGFYIVGIAFVFYNSINNDSNGVKNDVAIIKVQLTGLQSLTTDITGIKETLTQLVILANGNSSDYKALEKRVAYLETENKELREIILKR